MRKKTFRFPPSIFLLPYLGWFFFFSFLHFSSQAFFFFFPDTKADFDVLFPRIPVLQENTRVPLTAAATSSQPTNGQTNLNSAGAKKYLPSRGWQRKENNLPFPHNPNKDIRIAVQKTTPRWISVLRVVNKETYAVLSSNFVVIMYVVGIGESEFVLVDYY